ncbi:MAG: DUF4440 domain-containing protein [Caulobacterales bacterium]|nr:DUF4440 domain-containing protein [Caulobacterales bacterium]
MAGSRAIALAALALVSTDAAVADDPDTDAAALIQFGETWRDLYAKGDLTALMELYEPDAWLMTRHQPAKRGPEAIGDYLQSTIDSGAEASIAFDYEEVTVDGDYGFIISKWWLEIQPLDEADPVRDAGRSLVILKRGGGDQWRIWRDIDNHAADVTWSDDGRGAGDMTGDKRGDSAITAMTPPSR